MAISKQQPANPNPAPDTGNASNPSPAQKAETNATQLIPEEGEKYLREVSNPEDYADPQQSESLENQADNSD